MFDANANNHYQAKNPVRFGYLVQLRRGSSDAPRAISFQIFARDLAGDTSHGTPLPSQRDGHMLPGGWLLAGAVVK